MESISQEDSDKEKYLITQIMNYLYFECHNIDLFSTFELERIITFTSFNKQKTLNLIEDCTKEEIMKMIEEYDYKMIRKSDSAMKIDITPSYPIPKKENFYLNMRMDLDNLDHNKVWNFLTNTVNIIDMSDLLHSYDHHKLISKAKSVIKDKDNRKINEYFEKFYEKRENKYKEIFKANLEDNDIKFISSDIDYKKDFEAKKGKKNTKEESIKGDPALFYGLFIHSSELVKENILEFCDIFSIGKLGLVNKALSSYVYSKYPLERISKNYCIGIFKNTNIYLNDQDKIKESYKNYMSILAKRPRIRYSGIYYSRVRFLRVGETYGSIEKVINTISYYRIYRFFPNGEVFSITTPFIKSNKIMSLMNKDNIELRRGRYFVDNDDTLLIEMNIQNNSSHCYHYKVYIMYNTRLL